MQLIIECQRKIKEIIRKKYRKKDIVSLLLTTLKINK